MSSPHICLLIILLVSMLIAFGQANPKCHYGWRSNIAGLPDRDEPEIDNIKCEYLHHCYRIYCIYQEDNKQDISVWGCAPNQNKDVCKERSMDWFRERQKYPFPNFAELKCTDCTIGKFDEWYPEEYSLEPPVFPTTIPPKMTTDELPFFRTTTFNASRSTTTFGPAPEPQDAEDGTSARCAPIMGVLLPAMAIVTILMGHLEGIQHI